MHVHQQQSKTYKMEEPPALREVKHPHRDRTSVSRSPSTEQEVLSQFSGFSKEIEHFTRDPYTTHLKSCTQSTDYAFKGQEVHTYIDCEHPHRHMNDHLIQNTPDSLEKQFLQGKEKITCTDMENTPGIMNHMYRHGKHSRHNEYIYTRKHYTQHTHTLKENSTEFPTNGEGKFQHSGTSRLQTQC